MKTHLPKVNLDQRKWHVIDADGAVLGRLAVQVADILRGKNKPVYTPHLDAGDFVIVINAEKVRVTGKKETAKEYMSYSGWKGGEKYTTVEQLRAKQPERHRGFRLIGGPILPVLSILCCLLLMAGLPAITWVRFFVWLCIGLLVYVFYSRKRSEFYKG